MSKRGSEHGQLRAHEFEDAMNRDTVVPSGPFSKASDEELGKRRIIKATRRSRGGNSPNSRASRSPLASTTTTPGGSTNPFASVKLAPPTPAAGNPFSSVSFSTALSSSSNNSDPTDLSSMRKLRDERLSRLNETYFEKNRRMRDLNISSHLLRDVTTYLSYRKAICRPVEKAEQEAAGETATTKAPAPAPAVGFSFGSTASSTNSEAASKPAGFSFGAGITATTVTSPAAPGVSFGSATKSPAAAGGVSFGGTASKPSTPAPSGGFSFSGTASKATATPPAAAAAGGFSFPMTPAAKMSPATAAAPAAVGAGDDADDTDGTSRPEAVQHLVDPDWKTVHDVDRVKYFIYEPVEGSGQLKPKGYPSGPLRLEQGTSNPSNRRIVVREPNAGRVRLNLAICPGMPFETTERTSKSTGKVTKFLLFYAIREETKGREKFLFQSATTNDHDLLVTKFTEMTK